MNPSYLVAAPAIWVVAMIEYLLLNRGYGLKGALRAAAGYAVASVAAVLPMAVAGHAPERTPLIFASAVCFVFQLAYPLLYFADRKGRAEKFRHGADATVGMCAFGILTALLLLGGPAAWIVGPAELAMTAGVIVLATFYALYGSCMDAYGFRLMTQTNTNEVIEFIRYYPLWVSGLLIAALCGVLGAGVWVNASCRTRAASAHVIENSAGRRFVCPHPFRGRTALCAGAQRPCELLSRQARQYPPPAGIPAAARRPRAWH